MGKVNIIVTKDFDNVIGCNNDKIHNILRNIPNNLKRFKTITTGDMNTNVVIMGYNTWSEMSEDQKLMPNLIKVVITKKHKEELNKIDYVLSYDNFEFALEELNKINFDRIFIIGGSTIYNQALKLCEIDNIYITKLRTRFKDENDSNKLSYFPKIKYENYKTTMMSNIRIFNDVEYQYITLKHK
jgi:dihydrofolate reductase